ncbi:MAG: HlyC/CorC family transporter [Clostridia bacterium]|nr:HlyC/CorC family transporter [Clostridia bacterium]
MSRPVQILIVVICVLLSAFFSGSELALTAANKLRLTKAAEEGDKKARRALKVTSDYDRMLSGVLVGNNLVNILCSSVSTLLFLQLLSGSAELAAVVSTAVMTVVILIFGEITPKLIAANKPDAVARLVALPIRLTILLFYPVILLSTAIIRLIARARGEEPGETEPTVTEDELVSIIETAEEEKVIDEGSSEILQSAIEFHETTLGEILTPRTDMVTVDLEDDPKKILTVAMKSTFSRLPVYRDSIDEIVGVLHLNNYFKEVAEKGCEQVDVSSLCTEPIFFHKAMHLPAALRQMRAKQQHLAIVTDEFGGTLGLVTLEDVLEEIVGDIWDESDEIKTEIVRTAENTYEVSGDMNVSDFFEELEVDDRDFESDYTTVGGWAIEMLEGEPHEGDSFTYKNLCIVIAEMADMRVMKLTVLLTPETEEDEE